MSNTFLKVRNDMTLRDLSYSIGSSAVNSVLNVNGLVRERNIGSQYARKCNDVMSNSPSVSWKRKQEVLNAFSTDTDVFEHAAMQDDDCWKVTDQMMSFVDALAVPDTVDIVRYDDVMGNGVPVTTQVYQNVMNSLESVGYVDSSIFNSFSTIKPSSKSSLTYSLSSSSGVNGIFQSFKMPWNDVTFYSSLNDSSVSIPAYPESVKDPRSASYVTMPDVLYQYEPWYLYSSSGPREVSFEFHLHRQMWTGDERDGMANEMIRFIQASVYPNYSGSSVVTDTCSMYIKGSEYIRGIVSNVDVEWSGPIGSDGFYLEFTLSMTFVEVSPRTLSNESVRSFPLIQ